MDLKKEEEKVLIQKAVHNLMNDSGLNAWEKEFLASINDQLHSRDLSEKQIHVLNKIKQKYKISGNNK